MLAIDRKARQWCNDKQLETVRHIFAWPTNIPTRVIDLIANLPTAEETLERYLCEGRTISMRTEHLLLTKTFKAGGLKQFIEATNSEEARTLLSGYNKQRTTQSRAFLDCGQWPLQGPHIGHIGHLNWG